MAIYGLNFNGTQVPERAKALFPQRTKNKQGKWAQLQGVCQTEEECSLMCAAAQNGHRLIHCVYREGWFGVYIA